MAEPAYDDLLVPTDGSDLAIRALEEAVTIGELTDGMIHVLYVVDDATIAELAAESGLDDPSFDADVAELFDRIEAVGELAIEDVREAATRKGVDVVTEIRRGIPDEEILAYADETDSRPGGHGHTRPSRLTAIRPREYDRAGPPASIHPRPRSPRTRRTIVTASAAFRP